MRIIWLAGTIVCCAAAFCARAAEEEERPRIEGIWKWDFTMPDGSEITPRVWIREEDGTLSGTARFRPGTDVPVTNLVVKREEISFDVVRERAGVRVVTRYAGKVSGDRIKGRITSNRTGEEQTFDWEAKRSSSAEGTWRWPVSFGNFRNDATVNLNQNGEKLTGKMPSRRGGDVEIKNGKFKNGVISFETERERGGEKFVTRYSGQLTGDKIVGSILSEFGGRPRTNDWEAVRID